MQNATAIAELEDQFAAYKREDGRSAKAFCAAPSFQGLKCGFASEGEVSATIKKQCPLCGTLYWGLPSKLPAEVEGGDRSYNQYGVELLSLACKGPVVVRSVFKMLEEPAITPQEARSSAWGGTNCINSGLVLVDDELASKGGAASPVIRCELELPKNGSGDEAQRALRAKEGKCWICGLCSRGQGCPSGVGSGTATVSQRWHRGVASTLSRVTPTTGRASTSTQGQKFCWQSSRCATTLVVLTPRTRRQSSRRPSPVSRASVPSVCCVGVDRFGRYDAMGRGRCLCTVWCTPCGLACLSVSWIVCEHVLPSVHGLLGTHACIGH